MKIQNLLPTPFSLAIMLTVWSVVLALLFTSPTSDKHHLLAILQYWENGIWNEALLVFAYQMMLILVLGHILALSAPVQKGLDYLTKFVHNTSSAVVWVSFFTLIVAFFNWGLCLIFGAVLVRKIGDKANKEGFALNYPLLGAAGYVGMMAWHGGMSGSAPLKAAEPNHLASLFNEEQWRLLQGKLPDLIPTAQSIFSVENGIVYGILLLVVPLVFWWLSKRKFKNSTAPNIGFQKKDKTIQKAKIHFLESSSWVGFGFGSLILAAFGIQYASELAQFQLTPNMLNFFMLGLAFVLHGNVYQFKQALSEAIGGASGILIQFPLYFGIMGIMKDSGLVTQIAYFFSQTANAETLPILTFFSAGLVNIFVPSGGGQWAIQGPIVLTSGLDLDVPLPKMLMALAYGDQVTNMLQPFWALPLLAITKLKAQQIFPYTFLLFLVGSAVFIAGLLIVY